MIKFRKMKSKILSAMLSVSLLLLYSCNKNVSETDIPIVSSTTQNIISDSNTIVLSDAVKIAIVFLQERNHCNSVSIKSATTITKKGAPFLHVVNANNNAGFVLLSADSVYTPILAYNTKGNFSIEKKDLNTGIAVLFNSHSHSLDYIKNNKTKYTDSIAIINKSLLQELGRKYKINTATTSSAIGNNRLTPYYFPAPPPYTVSSTTTFTDSVGPLCGTAWDQSVGYNNDCPTRGFLGATAPDSWPNFGHWLAGCGPVAMGQIMFYWKYPNHTISGDLDWSKMHDITTGIGAQYISKLLADIGFAGGAIYNIGNTGETFMDDTNEPVVFDLWYGYSLASRTIGRDGQVTNPINGVAYASLLASEIMDHNRPCIITASTGETNLFLGLLYTPYSDAHTWVCEGDQRSTSVITYTTTYYWFVNGDNSMHINQTTYSNTFVNDYLYMNWGWGGRDNGFFYNSNINYTQPNQDLVTSDLSNSNFMDFQTIVYNIHP